MLSQPRLANLSERVEAATSPLSVGPYPGVKPSHVIRGCETEFILIVKVVKFDVSRQVVFSLVADPMSQEQLRRFSKCLQQVI
jgi:hypothetical protein